MRRLISAAFIVMVLCGPANAFDYTPENFGEQYNRVAEGWDYVDQIYPSECRTPGQIGACYRFGPGAGAIITPGRDGSAVRSIEYFFAMSGPPIHGLKFAPWVTARMVFPAMSYDEKREMFHAVGPDILTDIGGGQSLVRKGAISVMGEFFPRSRVWHLVFEDERVPPMDP